MTKVALISPGSLGAAVGKALAEHGHHVCCAVAGRSAATRARAEDAGFELHPSLDSMLAVSDFILSLATPAEAINVCVEIAAALERLRRAGSSNIGKRTVFIDGNSISPVTVRSIGDAMRGAGLVCAKASFFGPGNRLTRSNVVMLSGAGGRAAAALFDPCAEARFIGEDFAAAAAVKMCMSILTKSLPALYLESMQAARASGQFDAVLWLSGRLYPQISEMMSRLLSTYPAHFQRRIDEMLEMEQWLEEYSLTPPVARAARASLEKLRLDRYEGISFRDLGEMIDMFLSVEAETKAGALEEASCRD
jgi:L-threonate 2-dehydrogenase